MGVRTAEIPLLVRLDDDVRRGLLTKSTVRNESRDRVVYCAGEPLKYLYLVLAGSVKLVRHSKEGKELIVALVSEGEAFGSPYAQPSGALAQTLEPTTLLLVPHLALKRAMRESTELAFTVIENLERQRERAELALSRLAFDSVPRRLSRFLLETSDEESGELRFPLNQTEIANLIGSSRETVCSVLNQFRRSGWVALERGAVRVTGREELSLVG
jgi:CRP/FNR family cyclic AMP-dependent transcriptional regulator